MPVKQSFGQSLISARQFKRISYKHLHHITGIDISDIKLYEQLDMHDIPVVHLNVLKISLDI
ncbi:hypothetical protein [Mammaliicoccus sp. Dog046]|uniref:hypothetical protein n=1 Tax=Mammaliicoccus sp. Dog046 TaxID=3034233 RepID=UPI002B25FA0F|nr:hypothetical protein [Mammaliicoccus sp. Dog046]WQK84348.1 hypothetical protein P3U32_06820 [Mammaliicoccus sp. Dog046]